MRFIRPPFFFRWFDPARLLTSVPGGDRTIYLTFDDGPVPEATPEVLDILRAKEAKGTFFMVGSNVRKYRDVFERVVNEGHAVGNHTFHHLNGWHTAPGAYMEDVRLCQELTGSRLFRPPYGKFTPTQYLLLRNDYRFVLWSVLTYDFDRSLPPDRCLELAIRHTTPGSIVVFHDNVKAMNTVRQVLPAYLEHFSSQGFSFASMHHLDSPII